MIELTVKTLDSQNHAFTVEDDITVEQFKVKIAETVNISPDTQRIIYRGRVLQDSAKLSDYDVNGKVVHLVQRAPPAPRQRVRPGTPPPPQPRQVLRGFDGNAMYLGSMAFPSNLMESQGIVPPPPTHSLAGSRLNVARRMLRRAESVIQTLENPTARSTDQTPPEDNQEDETTPVIEAGIIVPVDNNDPSIDESTLYSTVQNSLLRETANTESAQRTREQSTTSSPESRTPRSSSAENLTTEARTENDVNLLAENASRTTEMAELLTMLGQLQARFAPFLERYQNFMQEDPIVTPENTGSTQNMLNRVSEVLHFLGHAYHSLSDIMVRVRTPPQRPLLCRPILIQHSAVVRTGIPIQVEAQINLSAERPSANNSNTNQPTASRTSFEFVPTASSTPAESGPTPPTGNVPQVPSLVGFPFMPTGMRIQSVPIEIRSIQRPSSSAPRPQNNNNDNMNTSESVNGSQPNNQTANSNVMEAERVTADTSEVSSEATDSSTTTTNTSTTDSTASSNNTTAEVPTSIAPDSGNTNTSANGGNERSGSVNFNNPNVEFFMEVTPEGITIDSLETTLVGTANLANDLLRGALNGPSPELLQSLVQVAGQLFNRNTFREQTTTPSTTPPASTDSTQTTAPLQNSTTGQNSQARGNTQTNPTTATHTRSTARPHVHLAHQALQGGFDPFLPCNSHHVTQRRRGTVAAAAAATVSPNNSTQNATTASTNRAETGGPRPTTTTPNAPNQTIYNFINGLINGIRTTYTRRDSEPSVRSQPTTGTTAGAAGGETNNVNTPNSNPESIPLPSFGALLTNFTNQTFADLIQQGTTLNQRLNQDGRRVENESIFGELISLLNFYTPPELSDFTTANFETLQRHRNKIQHFVVNRILNNATGPDGLDRGVDRLIREMQPFFESFRDLPVRDDIDIVRSTEMLIRTRLPNILNLASTLTQHNIHLLIDQCKTTIKQLYALLLHASVNGHPGAKQIVDRVLSRFLLNVPRKIRDWISTTNQVHFGTNTSGNFDVPENILVPYIIRQSEASLPSVLHLRQNDFHVDNVITENSVQQVEAMELDGQEATGSSNDLCSIIDDSDPLPNIVIGSEPWHGQVPEDWVPIIARDAQKQRRQETQGPFSDAYLSGMPSKRRKIVNSTKPEGSLQQVISESVRQAVTATGLASAAPLETVVQAAGASPEIQSAYTNLLRTSVQASLRDNEDYAAERFPNTSIYFNNPQQQ